MRTNKPVPITTPATPFALRLATLVWACVPALALAAGCAAPVRFPDQPLAVTPASAGTVRTYDTDADGRADYFTTADAADRTVRIGYDLNRDGEPDSLVDLDTIPAAGARHVVIILDGFGFDTVEAYQKEGRLGLFHPPARVISTFPPMTDLALADIFRSVPPTALEVVHFDHQRNALVGGDGDYLSLLNEDWARRCDYRAGTLTDPLSYLFPGYIFGQELGDLAQLFDRRDRPQIVAYLVSTAGLGTRDGLDGQRRALAAIDRLAEEFVWKTRGLVKVTLLSDHGHTLIQGERADFRGFLAGNGWRTQDRLDGPRDVVCIEYGLITYASFATRDRPALAAELVKHPASDLVIYDDGAAIVVQKPGGRAFIERRGDRYRYRAVEGDPLELAPLLAKAKADPATAALVDTDGYADDRAWLRLTLTHKYPDPAVRLWRAFHSQTEHVPDVIVSLKDGYFAGSTSRSGWLGRVASTHGDLAQRSSTAFIMSTAGPAAQRWPYLRCADLPPVLEALTGRPWPPVAQGGGRP